MKDQSLTERSAGEFVYGAFKASSFSDKGEIVLLAWNSPEGKKRLSSSRFANSFFHLANFFQPQTNPLYCGVATAVMMLNALKQPHSRTVAQPAISIPGTDGQTIAFPTFAQSTFLCDRTESIKPRAVIEYREKDSNGIYRPGLGLMDLKGLLETYGAKVNGSFASELPGNEAVNGFRGLLKNILTSSNQFFLIHFRSDLIGGLPRGHISPLGAYDEASDSVLVMDVAAHKGPWYWAPVTHVFQAMQAKYDTQPKGGGYLVVSE